MNRLIIIGNGFDLAHGLPTSYKDFIDDYWKIICKIDNQRIINYRDNFVEIFCELGLLVNDIEKSAIENINNYQDLILFINRNKNNSNGTFKIDFFNKFFEIICNNSIEKWVDIENLYYLILKEKSKDDFRKYNYLWDINQLNQEFEQVKNLLEKYLLEKVVNEFDFTKVQHPDRRRVWDVLKPISLYSNEDNILKEFISIEDVNEIREHFEKEKKEELANQLYFLNFNYTPIASIYCDSLDINNRINSRMNFIHGSLGNILENKINFGFGDEMDDDYKSIENLNNNEYLKNFKSFQYLQNSNYNDLLRYISSDKFQAIIMGHSCGLSDRTLLNTIFEHENCRSIKVFYHQREDGTDNYTEIVQNISRHFTDKKLMRSKIVNKTLCQPLPQNSFVINT